VKVLAVAHVVYVASPDRSEGELLSPLAALVRKETSAEAAERWRRPLQCLGEG
jgi:hypothetical protein